MKLKFIPDGSIVTDVNNDSLFDGYYRVVREDGVSNGYIRLNSVVWEDNDWEDADEIRDVGESLDMEVERMAI